jgi:hypothetical protein
MWSPQICFAAAIGSIHFWGFVGVQVCCRIKIIQFNLDFFLMVATGGEDEVDPTPSKGGGCV